MSRISGFILLAFLASALLFGASRDVNQDGVVDQGDVRALGRMVAGLDPADLRFDQNGDHALTLDDVNLLLEGIPSSGDSTMNSSKTAGESPQRDVEVPTSATKGLVFYALRKKPTGHCVVVAGEEGISPGDTVLGAFSTFQQAQYEVVSRCDQRGQTGRPTPKPEVPTPVVEQKPGILTVQATARGGVTKGVYLFDLRDGTGFYFDDIGDRAYKVRKRKLRSSLFEAVGRTIPASAGEILAGPICGRGGELQAILVVEPGTGNMGYLAGLDVAPIGGRPVRIAGRPASDLAGAGGHYALIMRRKGSGKTLGAYLIRTSTGEGSIFRDISEQPVSLRSSATSSLPSIEGPVSTCAILNSSEETSGFLMLDMGAGALYVVRGVDHEPTRLQAKRLGSNLLQAFPRAQNQWIEQRFYPIPVHDASGATKSILIVDSESGGLAMLEDFLEQGRFIGLNRNLYDVASLGKKAPGMIAGAPRIDTSGKTKGAWIFESSSSEILYLRGLQNSSELKIQRVVLH